MISQQLCRCGTHIPQKRMDAGLSTCKRCGDQDASRETEAKAARVGVSYNKGAYQYLGDPATARQALLEGGNRKSIPLPNNIDQAQAQVLSAKTRRSMTQTQTKVLSAQRKRRTSPSVSPSRAIVGVCRVNGGRERRYLYEGDLLPQGASAVVLWSKTVGET